MSVAQFPRSISPVAVLPVAGLGTRLRPLSDTLPKELLPVGARSALERIVDELASAGITDFVFVVSPAKEDAVRQRFGDSACGRRFRYAVQSEMRGLGDAILCAESAVGDADRILVALGDAVFDEPQSGGVVARLIEAQAPIAIAVQAVPPERLSRYGVVHPAEIVAGDSFAIDGIVEKPAPGEAPSEYAVCARYLLPRSVFRALRTEPVLTGHELPLTGAIARLLANGVPGRAIPLRSDEARHDIGSFDTYFRAFVTFALKDPQHGAALREYLGEMFA